MAETPISVDGQIDIHYTVATIPHVAQWRCEIVTPGLTPPFTILSKSSGSILWTDGVDDAVDVLRPILASDATINNAVLQRYNAGVYEQIDTYSIGLAGTGAAAHKNAEQETYTFKDLGNKLVKVVLQEGMNTPPDKIQYANLGAAYKTFVDDVLSNSAGTIGDWFLGRGGNDVIRFLNLTISINKYVQRKRNLG